MSIVCPNLELNFTIEYDTSLSHIVKFKIYEIVGSGLNLKTGTYTVPFYGDNYLPSLPAVPYIEGDVRFDGCSNWMFTDCKANCMLHACSKEELENIGKILAQCWDIANSHFNPQEKDYVSSLSKPA